MFGKKRNGGGSPAGLPQLTRIELTKKNLPLRITLLVLAVLIALVAFGYGISSFFGSTPGWTEIKCTSGELNCGQDFVLNYDLGASEESATADNKKLTALYNQAAVNAYRIFSKTYEGNVHNLRYVNRNINQEITVDPALYKAFSVITAARNRAIFLAPVYAEYQNLFLCDSETEAKLYDPTHNPEQLAFIAEVMTFAADPQMISLQLLGDNKVRLEVAEEYVAFAKANELENYLDFSWMTNAFIADYLADTLIANGFTRGYISSYDGFTRNLCPAEENYSLNLFHREQRDIFMPATLQYSGGNSVVALRDFPLSGSDSWHYYVYSDGRIVNLMLDPATGSQKQAVSSLVCYSQKAGCGEILMQMMPVYLADELDTAALNDLKDEGIYSLYPEGKTVYYNAPESVLKMNPDFDYSTNSF